MVEYNLPHEKVEIYKPFPGRNVDQMPVLLDEGRSPMWASRFMRRRIDHSVTLPDLKNYLDVSDLAVYDSKERSTDVKFILTVDKHGNITQNGRKALELINPDVKLTSDRAVPISEVYDELEGLVVPREEMGVIRRRLTEKEILASRPWRIFTRDPNEVPSEFAEDENLLKEYVGWVKSQTKSDENMGVYPDEHSDVAKLRLWYVGGLRGRSSAYGRCDLDLSSGRLVGVAPEAQSREKSAISNPLEARIVRAVESGIKFQRKDGLVFVPVQGVKIDQ